METTQDINSILSKLKKLQRLYEGAKAINSEAVATLWRWGREDGRKVNITRGGIAASNTNPNQIAQ